MAGDTSALWLLRHGQSVGNVIRDSARGRGVEVLDIAERDMDVPLSEFGHAQAAAFGNWLREQPAGTLPHVVLTSPYKRAIQTATVAMEAAELPLAMMHVDERARARVRSVRPAHPGGNRQAVPRRDAAAPTAGKVLPPASGEARAGSTSRCACDPCVTPSSASIAAGGYFS